SGKALANFSTVGANYFDALGVPILKGRAFSSSDSANSAPVAVVNETFVKTFFPGRDPVGSQIWVEVGGATPITKINVVGVSRDTKYGDIREKLDAVVFLPMMQETDGRVVRLLVKPRGRLDGVMPAIIKQAAAINPDISVEMRVVGQQVRD